jgi:hypothetical protein
MARAKSVLEKMIAAMNGQYDVLYLQTEIRD